MEEAKADTKALAGEISKVMASADKLASTTTSYRDTLVSKPPHLNGTVANPRVLGGMDCRSKQILIDILDRAEGNVLSISLTSILEKANEAVGTIKDTSKPTDTKVVAALKMRGNAILLTFSSKEAVS